MPQVVSRDVDALDALPDAKLKAQDAAYLTKNGIDVLFGSLLRHVIQLKPADPLQYMIDSVEYSPEYATQDPATGLPEHRKNRLQDVFRIMDSQGLGKISINELHAFMTKYGGQTLPPEELESVFTDLESGDGRGDGNGLVSLHQFLLFFSKVARSMPNAQFNEMVAELTK